MERVVAYRFCSPLSFAALGDLFALQEGRGMRWRVWTGSGQEFLWTRGEGYEVRILPTRRGFKAELYFDSSLPEKQADALFRKVLGRLLRSELPKMEARGVKEIESTLERNPRVLIKKFLSRLPHGGAREWCHEGLPRFCDWILKFRGGETSIDDLKQGDIEGFVRHCVDVEKCDPTDAGDWRGGIESWSHWLYAEGYLPRYEPFRQVEPPPLVFPACRHAVAYRFRSDRSLSEMEEDLGWNKPSWADFLSADFGDFDRETDVYRYRVRASIRPGYVAQVVFFDSRLSEPESEAIFRKYRRRLVRSWLPRIGAREIRETPHDLTRATAALVDDFLHDLGQLDKPDGYAGGYRTALRPLVEWLEGVKGSAFPIGALTGPDVEAFLRRAAGAMEGVVHPGQAVGKFFEWIVDEAHLPFDPTAGPRKTRKERADEIQEKYAPYAPLCRERFAFLVRDFGYAPPEVGIEDLYLRVRYRKGECEVLIQTWQGAPPQIYVRHPDCRRPFGLHEAWPILEGKAREGGPDPRFALEPGPFDEELRFWESFLRKRSGIVLQDPRSLFPRSEEGGGVPRQHRVGAQDFDHAGRPDLPYRVHPEDRTLRSERRDRNHSGEGEIHRNPAGDLDRPDGPSATPDETTRDIPP